MRRRALAAFATGVVLIGLTALTLNATLTLRPLPTIDGHFRFLGLHERAEVTRDGFGVARIEANNAHDLFFLQGYVTAQDRFAQMDEMRRATELTASEPPSGEAAPALQAYAEGVTKWIEQHAEARALPAVIALSGQRPERWTAMDSLGILAAILERPSPTRCIGIPAERTLRGAPIIAADLTEIEDPGWYQIGLQAPGLTALGLSLPGVPGVVSGQNGQVAWSLHHAAGRRLDPVRSAAVIVSALGARSAGDLSGPALQNGPLSGCVADAAGVAGRDPFILLDAAHVISRADLAGAAPPPAVEDLLLQAGRMGKADVDSMRSLLVRTAATDTTARIVIDLGDLDATRAALSTGQSGHPAARHYGDQRQLWEAGQLHRLAWTRERIARLEGVLVLRPR